MSDTPAKAPQKPLIPPSLQEDDCGCKRMMPSGTTIVWCNKHRPMKSCKGNDKKQSNR